MQGNGGVHMLYWVDVNRLQSFMQMRGVTVDDVKSACHIKTKQDLFQRLVTEGGPTRDCSLIGEIGRAIRIPDPEFVKYKREKGDASDDLSVLEAQNLTPLDYDESQYIDQSMGMEKLKEYGLI
jgi:hypothetical protein